MPRVIRVDHLSDGSRVEIFVCHWCDHELRLDEEFHHEVGSRACCTVCFGDENGNYRGAYGPDATPESEAQEVLRATGKSVRRSK